MFKVVSIVTGVLALTSQALAGTSASPSKPALGVGIKDSNVAGGLEDLDVSWAGTYKVNDFTLGFKFALDAIRDRPESVFLRKTFETLGGGKLALDASYDLPKNGFAVLADWANSGADLVVSAVASTKNKIEKLSLKKDQVDVFGADQVSVQVDYEPNDKKATVKAGYAKGDTGIKLEIDNVDRDAALSVSHTVNEDTFIPSVSLKTGSVAYGWKRKVKGGSVESKLELKDKLTVLWKDEATSGNWEAKAEIPLDDSAKKTKIKVSRNWDL